MASDPPIAANITQPITVTRRERSILLVAVLIISICALTYELIVATLSSYLLGDSITQFSFTIGFFLFAMGLGSLLSRRIKRHTLRWFIVVELTIAVFGGTSAIVLYATFSTVDLYYRTVMILFSLVIGICVGLEIPLLTRIVADRSTISAALADVLSVDYIGALIGSLAFPIILLPLLGVTQTAFLMGLLNVVVASLCLYTFKDRIPPDWQFRLWIGSGVAAVVMLGGALATTDIVRVLEQQFYSANIIYTHQTPYQRVVLTNRGDDFRLFLDGNLQFSSLDEYRYHEVLVHPVLSIPRNREQILVLGGGDGFVARELLKYEDIESITIVDLDPAVTDLAQTHPILLDLTENAMNDPRVALINTDAFTYIQETDRIFNAIIIDLPDPNNESLSKLYSNTFYTMLREHLTPDGAFITQATSPYFARRSFWTIYSTIESADFYVTALHTYVPTFGEWGFIIGTPLQTPELSVPAIPLRYLTADVLRAAAIFDPDMAREIDYDEVNTLDNPILPRFYMADWRHWN